MVRVTFAGKSYGAALAALSALGLRLASPCYEALPQGAAVAWSPMGQEASFATDGTLLVETTLYSSTQWQQQVRATAGVVHLDTAPTLNCPSPSA